MSQFNQEDRVPVQWIARRREETAGRPARRRKGTAKKSISNK